MINKKKIEIKIMKKIIIYLILIVNIILYLTNTAISKVVGDKIIIGTTLSITGNSSSETLFYKNQFDRAVENINSLGGVYVGGKSYLFEIIYYDDASNIKRANHLIKRLIQNDGVEFLIVLQNVKLSEEVKNIIENNHISIAKSYEALSIYKKAFETVNSVKSKTIKNFIANNR
jgi:branched-chain amino acid transport system substrate-binding protein